MREKSLKKKKEKSYGWWKKKLDALFSKYIRGKYSRNGVAQCYTCDKKLPITKMHCGHFIPRHYLATRWEEDNCRPQCVGCNLYGNGQILDFEEHLIKDIGLEKVQELKRKRNEITRLTVHQIQEMISLYGILLR